MPSPHTLIVVFCVSALWLLGYLQGKLHERNRRRASGLYLHPGFWFTRDASPLGNPVKVRIPPLAATSTGCRPDGLKPVARVSRALQARLSSSTASGSSTTGAEHGSVMGGSHGPIARGTIADSDYPDMA